MSSGNKSLVQTVVPIIGAFYVLIGVIGFFVTGFSNFVQNTDDKLIGFSINPFHNLVHLAIGAFLIIMALNKNKAVGEGATMGVGLFYIVAFVIGVYASDNLTIISMQGSGDLENFNHIVNGVALLTIGLLSSGQTQATMKRQGLA
jgi:ABC-type transport system involved in multi-copper enzyme maturation permease subunit